MKTTQVQYTDRLAKQVWWKQLLDVQAPYRRHIRSLDLGRVLEVGCGVGRNLVNLGRPADCVGVDHNETSIELVRQKGFVAFTSADFHTSEYAQKSSFDTILIAHVFEHMTPNEAKQVLLEYLPYLKIGGRLVVITPQSAGYASDPTHVTMMDHPLVGTILESCGAKVIRQYSFPFPLLVGRIFKYNEYVSIARLD